MSLRKKRVMLYCPRCKKDMQVYDKEALLRQNTVLVIVRCSVCDYSITSYRRKKRER
jgi:hypothetical protein